MRKSPSKIWRKQVSKYTLTGSKFKKTGDSYYPPRYVDPKDHSNESKPVLFEESAKLVTWSIVHSAPEGFERFVPYIIGILEFKNGQRITAQIVDVSIEDLKKGDILHPTFRKVSEDGHDGVINYGLKWTKD